MLKVVTIVGTRPEIIKMSRVIYEFDQHTKHVLAHTGQNYDFELNQVFFDELGVRKPDYFFGAVGKNASQTIAKVIEASDELFEKEKPDAVMLYGDTNSCLAVIAAKRRRIPVFHMEAGNRCFDERVPEELNRKVLDHLSDINLVLTEHARRYLIAEGIRSETIIKTGSHMREVLEYYAREIEASQVLSDLNLRPREYFLVSTHREENVDANDTLDDLLETMNAVADRYGLPVIVSTHPRTQKRIDDLGPRQLSKLIHFAKPFGFFDYIKLQTEARCVISDSGTITEESSILNFPAVMIRSSHERPEGMDVGAVIMSGMRSSVVLSAIKITEKQLENDNCSVAPVDDYRPDRVSQKILRIVLSYTPYVNSTVWRKF